MDAIGTWGGKPLRLVSRKDLRRSRKISAWFPYVAEVRNDSVLRLFGRQNGLSVMGDESTLD